MPDESYRKRVHADYKKRLEIGHERARCFLVGLAHGQNVNRLERSEDFIREYADYYARHQARTLPDCWLRFNRFGTIDPIPNYPPQDGDKGT